LPTGCEITSLTALLQYLGFDVEKETMANEYLFCTYDTAKYTLEDAYVGTPDAEDGFGCYAPVLVDAADRYLQTQNGEQKAIDLTGSNEETICRYVASGYPVVMWITIGLYDVYEELGWITEDGEEVMWCELEHCVLLHGYDKEEDTVYVCDPMNGDVTYDMERYFQIYEDMHRRAMTIY
ncbi:MAG: C39 family peptidase, partial [Ruminococcus sp.]